MHHHPGRARLLVGLTCAAALLVAGCGSDDSGDSSETTAAVTAAPTTAAGDTATTSPAPATTGGTTASTDASASTPVEPDTSDCPDYSGDGFSDDEIVFGGSAPLSGPVAGAANTWMGADAYFAYINDQGGVTMKDGKTRKLTLKMLDDTYQAPVTKTNVDQLVNQDGVFALFNVFGSAGNAAVADDVNRFCVPSIFQQVGGIELSGPEHPWFLTGIPPYAQEAKALADYLVTIKPDATVAVLYQNDAAGTTSLEGFKDAIEGTGIKVVAAESYETTDPDVTAQMTTLADSKADVFLAAAVATKCVQGFNEAQARGWEPIKLGMITCGSVDLLASANPGATDGLIQAIYKKDVNTDAADPAMQRYLEWFDKTHSGQSPSAGVAGWGYGQWITQVLEQMPENTRASFIATAGSMTFDSDMFYDGITQQTDVANGDYLPIEGFQLVTLDTDAKTLNPVDPPVVVDYNGQFPLR